MIRPRLPIPLLLGILLPALSGLHAEPLLWGGFRVDLPPGYQARESRSAGQISFRHPRGALCEIDLRTGPGDPVSQLEQVLSRLGPPAGAGPESPPEPQAFDYRGCRAALARLEFSLDSAGRPLRPQARGGGRGRAYQGWALCVDRGEDRLLALAYGPAEDADLELLALSCLDSLAPTAAHQYYCGPVTEFAWPRRELRETPLYNTGVRAAIADDDADAAQALVDREFRILRQYEQSPQWQEAWRRFYRMIRRDSWARLADALFQLERSWNTEALSTGQAGQTGLSDYALAGKALAYVQSFRYERDLMGSDFVNLVSALTEGRGDCDSRAMLWALFLAQANIPAGIMVSRDYGHAMGIADIEGPGARFPFENKQYLVAETTAQVELGLIGQGVSEIAKWLGVTFD